MAGWTPEKGDHLNVCFWKPTGEGNQGYWIKIGVAFLNPEAKGKVTIKLDALPLHFDGTLKAFLPGDTDR